MARRRACQSGIEVDAVCIQLDLGGGGLTIVRPGNGWSHIDGVERSDLGVFL